MKIHEYQAKALLKKAGVAVPRGEAVESVEDAVAAAERLGGSVWCVKAQIHAGGRGKAGGVKVARSLEEVRAAAEALLHHVLVTKQTGPAGKMVERLYVEEGLEVVQEFYAALLVDRVTQTVCLMASSMGGVEIEEVAESHPEAIMKLFIDPLKGLTHEAVLALAKTLGLTGEAAERAAQFFEHLYEAFLANDASLLETNPMALLASGEIVAADAKVNFDDNALFRHPDIQALRDVHEEEPRETEAAKFDLNYIGLDGDIGCMVNGAGLAMATMDIIQAFGGSPANFLDVGGGATAEKVAGAFSILLSDSKVRCIFINIFGGIMRCDVLAEGIVQAAKEVSLPVPLVVRLRGTNWERGAEILAQSGLAITYEPDLAKSAHLAVSLAKGGVQA